MILVEKHSIKNNKKNRKLFYEIDDFCDKSKSLRNYTNYIIKQCSRISYKLKRGEILDSWEKKLIYDINNAIACYNNGKTNQIKYIDHTNGFIANAYFLSWYLKTTNEYKAMPLAICAQIVIQEICRDWKAFYKSMKAYKNKPLTMLGRPKPPKYYDKEDGRNWIVLTNQNFKIVDNKVNLPKIFDILLKIRHKTIKQIRFITRGNKIHINVLYEINSNSQNLDKSRALSIDLGVDNLVTVVSNTEINPFIITGKPLKSNNQFYNKKKSILQEQANIFNDRYFTNRLYRLTERRNNKVEDYLHKVSKIIIDIAIQNNIGTIIIGNNKGWKQEVNLGKKNNQTFVNIPYSDLIAKIQYKAKTQGISVIVTEESYTSGTSYLDNELPIKANYNKSRRISRGQFKSSKGIINADVNAAYQIMKKVDSINVPIKMNECVKTLNVV